MVNTLLQLSQFSQIDYCKFEHIGPTSDKQFHSKPFSLLFSVKKIEHHNLKSMVVLSYVKTSGILILDLDCSRDYPSNNNIFIFFWSKNHRNETSTVTVGSLNLAVPTFWTLTV